MDQMQQPQVPEKKEKNKWVGGVMLAFWMIEAFSNIGYMYNYAFNYRFSPAMGFLGFISMTVLTMAMVFITLSVVNRKHSVMGVVGCWIFSLVFFLNNLRAMGFLFSGRAADGDVYNLFSAVALFLQFVSLVLLAVWMHLLLLKRKQVKAFVPAIFAAVGLLLYFLVPLLEKADYLPTYGYVSATFSNGQTAARYAVIFFFAALWMKEEMKDLPVAGQREEVYSAPDYTQPYDQQPYGQPQDYGQPPQDPNTYQGNQWQGGDPYNRY